MYINVRGILTQFWTKSIIVEETNAGKIEKTLKDLHKKSEPCKAFSLSELCLNRWMYWKIIKGYNQTR